jgi:hypothetical protein
LAGLGSIDAMGNPNSASQSLRSAHRFSGTFNGGGVNDF